MRIVQSLALVVLLTLPACAQKPPAAPPVAVQSAAQLSGTVKAILANGITMTTQGQKLDIFYNPDGRLEGVLGMVGGTWKADGARLCINVPGMAENQCLTYPDGKTSGDSFVIEGTGGPIPIRIH